MKTFIALESFFYVLFSEHKMKVIKKEELEYHPYDGLKPYAITLEIEIEGNVELVKILPVQSPAAIMKLNPTKRLLDFEFDYYVNPPENSILIFDRWVFQNYWHFIFQNYGIGEFEKLIKRYKEKNVKVIFNFAFFEPTEYENLYYFLMKYDYNFECIKITDYELFKNNPNFIFSKTFSLFHLVADLMSYKILDYFDGKLSTKNELLNLSNLFDVDNIERPSKIFSHLTLKPRPHRINFINRLFDLDIIDYGYCTLNKSMYDEYDTNRKQGILYRTENCINQTEWLYDYFKDIDYRGYEYYSKKMTDTLGKNFWSHLRQYLDNKEYTKSYIDVVGETHILFNTIHPYFSEKSYYPILAEKFFIIYGANSFYTMLEEMGCYNCLDLFGLDSSYYQIENPYEQGNIIAEKLKELIDKIERGEFDLEGYYIKNKENLVNTKKKILDKFLLDIQPAKQMIFL